MPSAHRRPDRARNDVWDESASRNAAAAARTNALFSEIAAQLPEFRAIGRPGKVVATALAGKELPPQWTGMNDLDS